MLIIRKVYDDLGQSAVIRAEMRDYERLKEREIKENCREQR
jgi:hypothetical protein